MADIPNPSSSSYPDPSDPGAPAAEPLTPATTRLPSPMAMPPTVPRPTIAPVADDQDPAKQTTRLSPGPRVGSPTPPPIGGLKPPGQPPVPPSAPRPPLPSIKPMPPAPAASLPPGTLPKSASDEPVDTQKMTTRLTPNKSGILPPPLPRAPEGVPSPKPLPTAPAAASLPPAAPVKPTVNESMDDQKHTTRLSPGPKATVPAVVPVKTAEVAVPVKPLPQPPTSIKATAPVPPAPTVVAPVAAIPPAPSAPTKPAVMPVAAPVPVPVPVSVAAGPAPVNDPFAATIPLSAQTTKASKKVNPAGGPAPGPRPAPGVPVASTVVEEPASDTMVTVLSGIAFVLTLATAVYLGLYWANIIS